MAGAAKVIAALDRPAGLWYWALVPDVRGAEQALEAEVDAITVTVSASEVYSNSHSHMSVVDPLLQPVAGLVEGEVAEMEFLGRKSPTRAVACVAA